MMYPELHSMSDFSYGFNRYTMRTVPISPTS
jgi:hypothetical protein